MLARPCLAPHAGPEEKTPLPSTPIPYPKKPVPPLSLIKLAILRGSSEDTLPAETIGFGAMRAPYLSPLDLYWSLFYGQLRKP